MKVTYSKSGGFQSTREQYNLEIARMEAEIEDEQREDKEIFMSIQQNFELLNANINNMYMALLQAKIMRRH